MSDEFRIRAGPGVVVVESQKCLPFEPRGWLLEQRTQTRQALSDLTVSTGVLRGTYECLGIPRADVENILIYNVGVGSLRALSKAGLVLELGRLVPGADYPHVATYEVAGSGLHFSHWELRDQIAAFQNVIVPKLTEATKPEVVWWAIKRGARDVQTAAGEYLGPFALYLEVRVPSRTLTSAAALIKPLADGVIAAFHRHVDHLTEAPRRLATRLTIDPKMAASHLESHDHAVLGPRRLIWVRSEGIQWNPADDRCVAIALRVETHEQPDWTISGTLNVTEPRTART